MNVNLYAKSSIQNYSVTAINSVQYEQKNDVTSSARNKDSIEISQSGRLAAAFDIDEDTANRMETAIQNADIPALLEEFRRRRAVCPRTKTGTIEKSLTPMEKFIHLPMWNRFFVNINVQKTRLRRIMPKHIRIIFQKAVFRLAEIIFH